MKSIILSILIAFFAIPSTFSKSDCSKYYPMQEGATFQYTNYNAKGKTEGIVDYEVTEVTNNGDSTAATMAIEMKDEKGKDIYNTSYSFSCADNKINIDYQSLLPQSMIDQMGDMEMEITGSDIELPNELIVGESLPDANVTMTMNMAGMNMKTEVNILNRKVETKEMVDTPAGSFDCYVIYSDSQTKTMGMNKTFPSKLWLAEGVGMVKQESYNQKGKLISSTVLTALSK
ncbi:hypothetical protein [Muriicola sp.]|uniref:TapB family protein n=1 Tax=Muriicola sp. TaxID=2020856 RepID=UPI003C71EA60